MGWFQSVGIAPFGHGGWESGGRSSLIDLQQGHDWLALRNPSPKMSHMVNYPIRVERSHYRGRDPRKLEKAVAYNRDAALLESVANEMIEEKGPGVYHYYDIADRTGLPVKRVGEIMFSVDCGSNGFTVNRGKDGPVLTERLRHLTDPSE